jgi:hypothetical protein
MSRIARITYSCRDIVTNAATGRQKARHRLRWPIIVAYLFFLTVIPAMQSQLIAWEPLASTNLEVPFYYSANGTTRWPIVSHPAADPLQVGDEVWGRVDQDSPAKFPFSNRGMQFEFSDGALMVQSAGLSTSVSLTIEVRREGRVLQTQILQLHPAPPTRSVSYMSDQVDDLIRVFWDGSNRRFRPLAKHNFDAYFRRIQAHGVRRLVVWQSPFPLTTDEKNFAPEDWQRYRGQATAIIESAGLTEDMRRSGRKIKSYDWLRFLMAMRMDPNFALWYTQSAQEHGVQLTACFRPFEVGLMKYYQVPAFQDDGTYLWQFLPQTPPSVNYHPDVFGFAHYREILRRAGNVDEATPASIEIGGLSDIETLLRRHAAGEQDFVIRAADSPPLDSTSWVLVRDQAMNFELRKFASMRDSVQSRWKPLQYRLRRGANNKLIVDLVDPATSRFLIVQAATRFGSEVRWPVSHDVVIRSKRGNVLGRENIWVSVNGNSTAELATKVGGIPADGMYHTDFQAIEESVDYFRKRLTAQWSLKDAELVIDLGDPWSTEMVDFQRPAARKFAIRQLRSILKHGAFDEIMLNTRSHTQLAGSSGDGASGPQTKAYYRLFGRSNQHNGVDRAYAPVGLSESAAIRNLAKNRTKIHEITNWQPGEWQGNCQTNASPFVWRYERNVAIADGVRLLLQDFEAEFPTAKIRCVIPQSDRVEKTVRKSFKTLKNPKGAAYGEDYFAHVWGSGNHIRAIGEGMSMLNMKGLRTQPIYLGIRHLPDTNPLAEFLTACQRDLPLATQSSVSGPRAIVYEAQATLRHSDKAMATKRREEILRELLQRRDMIDEVLLYESVDWLYALPLDGTDVYGFLD